MTLQWARIIYIHCTKTHKPEDIHNTQILISNKEPIFRLYKALLLIKKTKTAKPTEKTEERARHTRQDTQMANKHMKKGSTV